MSLLNGLILMFIAFKLLGVSVVASWTWGMVLIPFWFKCIFATLLILSKED